MGRKKEYFPAGLENKINKYIAEDRDLSEIEGLVKVENDYVISYDEYTYLDPWTNQLYHIRVPKQ